MGYKISRNSYWGSFTASARKLRALAIRHSRSWYCPWSSGGERAGGISVTLQSVSAVPPIPSVPGHSGTMWVLVDCASKFGRRPIQRWCASSAKVGVPVVPIGPGVLPKSPVMYWGEEGMHHQCGRACRWVRWCHCRVCSMRTHFLFHEVFSGSQYSGLAGLCREEATD